MGKIWDFLFEDCATGEQFFVECENMKRAAEILAEYGILPETIKFLGVCTVEEADILGYDTY
jgi:hypothetical protein